MAGYNNFIGYGYPNNMAYGNNYPATNTGYQPMQNNYQQGQQKVGIEWVDGEVGAKAFQLPVGWPANVPMPLWDTNDTVIYLKSINQMGMPNPLQKVHYTIEKDISASQSMLPTSETMMNGQSNTPDMSHYATKDDMESMAKELKASINSLKEMLWKDGKSAV